MPAPFPERILRISRYPEQFTTLPDVFHVAIPRAEIVAAMLDVGEALVLDQVAMAVAVVADAVEANRSDS